MNRPSKPTASAGSHSRRRATIVVVALVCAVIFVTAIPVVTVLLAKRAIARREPAKALEWLKIATIFGNRNGEIDFLRARCFRKQGKVEEFRQSILAASDRGYQRQTLEREQLLLQAQAGRMKEIDEKIAEIFQTAGDDTAEVCEAYVSGLLLNFRQGDAVRVIDSWSQDYPEDPYPLFVKGRIYQNSNKVREAEECYRRALAINPHAPPIRFQLAELLISAKRIDEAMPLLQVLTTDPKFGDLAWLRTAKCARMRGDAASRKRALEQIKSPNQLPPGEYELEVGLQELETQNYEQAVTQLQRSRDLQPGSTEAGHALAQALRAAGRREEADRQALYVAKAQEELQRSDRLQNQLADDFTNYELRLEIGQILLTYGDPARGRAWIQSVINAMPGHRRANAMMADHYEMLGQSSAKYAELAKQYRERAGKDAHERVSEESKPATE